MYKVGSILYYFHIQFPNSEKCLHHNKYTKNCIVCRRFNEIRHLPFSTAVGATGFPQGFVFGNGASTKFLLSKIFGFGTSVFWASSACWVLSLVEEVFELFIGLLSVSKLVAIGGCASTCEVSTLIVTETEFISTDAAMPSSCIHKPYLAKVKPAILNMHPTRMHSSRMRTARSLTVSPYLVVFHARPPPPEQPRMPPGATTHAPPEQPRTPPGSNHACPRATTPPLGSNHACPPCSQNHRHV